MTREVRSARNAVAAVFILNGLLLASWISRIPEARESLELSNARLGVLLLALAIGSVTALPTAGALIERWSAATVVRAGAVLCWVGVAVAAFSLAAGQVVPTGLGLLVYGAGMGIWDVAMNVEGAEVERRIARTVMPRFHAGFSLGTVAGAGLGAASLALDVPTRVHLVGLATLALVVVVATTPRFLPGVVPETGAEPRASAWSAWKEPQTLLIGLMVLALALTEGTANDWLALALVDGYGVEDWVGVAGFAVFVSAMTAGRMIGPLLLDRWGRVPVLLTTMAAAAGGVLLIVLGPHPALVVLGIILWGTGASLGFPVGMSAAADDPRRAAARVSVVSTIGYGAFLAGPPLLGFAADRVGTLNSLLIVALVLLPSALVAPSARERHLVES